MIIKLPLLPPISEAKAIAKLMARLDPRAARERKGQEAGGARRCGSRIASIHFAIILTYTFNATPRP